MCGTLGDNIIHLPKIVNCDISDINVLILTAFHRAFVAESLNLDSLFNSDNNDNIQAKNPCSMYPINIVTINYFIDSLLWRK